MKGTIHTSPLSSSQAVQWAMSQPGWSDLIISLIIRLIRPAARARRIGSRKLPSPIAAEAWKGAMVHAPWQGIGLSSCSSKAKTLLYRAQTPIVQHMKNSPSIPCTELFPHMVQSAVHLMRKRCVCWSAM